MFIKVSRRGSASGEYKRTKEKRDKKKEIRGDSGCKD
jgi:hypothetical protein